MSIDDHQSSGLRAGDEDLKTYTREQLMHGQVSDRVRMQMTTVISRTCVALVVVIKT